MSDFHICLSDKRGADQDEGRASWNQHGGLLLEPSQSIEGLYMEGVGWPNINHHFHGHMEREDVLKLARALMDWLYLTGGPDAE